VGEESVGAAKVFLQEREQQRTVDRIAAVPVPQTVVDAPVPQAFEENVEVTKVVGEIVDAAEVLPQECVQQRTADQMTAVPRAQTVVDAAAPRAFEEIINVPKVVAKERELQRTVEQVVVVPAPPVVEESQECVHTPTSGQVVDVTRADCDETDEGNVEVADVDPLERVRQLSTGLVDDCDNARSSTSDVEEHRSSSDHSAGCAERLGAVFGEHWSTFSEKTRKRISRAIRSGDIHALLEYLGQ